MAQQKPAGAPGSPFSFVRGLCLAVGFGIIFYEITYDNWKHPWCLPYCFTFIATVLGSESILSRAASWVFRMEHVSVQVGPWIRVDMSQGHPIPPPPPIVKTLQIPLEMLPGDVAPRRDETPS